MFCPNCGDEYQAGFTRCADCDTDLVANPPAPPEPAGPFAMATVLETGDQTLIAVAKSILDSAGIACIARNERLQNLFGWGAIGAGYSVAMGPIRLQVLEEDEADARELLTAQAIVPAEDE
jgi:hypothetical protein